MHVRHIPNDSEAKTAAIASRAIYAIEPFEDVLALRFRNGYAIVAHSQHDLAVRQCLDAYVDCAAGFAVPDRIVDQIAEHIFKQRVISLYRDVRISTDESQVHSLVQRLRHPILAGCADQLSEVQRFEVDLTLLTRFSPSKGQQLVY